MTTYECLRCGARREVDASERTAGERTCAACGGPLRDLAQPHE